MDESPLREPEQGKADIPERGHAVFVRVLPTTLERRAAQVGTMAGQLAVLFRDIRKRLQEPGHRGDDTLSRIGATARDRIDELRRQASAHTEHWQRTAKDKAARFQRRAQTGYEQAQSRTRGLVREYPLRVVAAVGAAGFLLGVAVRTWRAKRAG